MKSVWTNLSAAQRDRAAGVLVGTAAGDALGAGYEFGGPLPADAPVDMIGGGLGPFAPGEWTDDTAMAVAIAEVAAAEVDLRHDRAQDQIVERWHWWARSAKDVGVQTRSVLSAAGRDGISADTARKEAAALHQRTERTAGNGSLMRTAPVALAYLDDEAGLVEAARALSELTHFDPEAGDACVLWCAAIRHAVLTGEFDVRIGLGHIDSARRDLWASRIEDAEAKAPADFARKNGWVVAALQGAWSAVVRTPVPREDPGAGVFRADHLRLGLEAAVRGGGDTDTVAAIAGGLLGGAHGLSAVPARWRLMLKGWPGLNTRGLVHLATQIVGGGPNVSSYGSHLAVVHPHDGDVWIGAEGALRQLPARVDAVVSLCRVADGDIPADVEQLDVRLIDKVGRNPHLDFVLLDTVQAIERFRADGRRVFLHCAHAQSRTPTVAALYGARRQGLDIDRALAEVCAALPAADPNPDFRAALRRLHPR